MVKEAAIASSINAIAISDLEGRLTYVNAAFLNMWGYDHETEVQGKPVTDFWVSAEQANGVVEALQNEGSWIGEMSAKKTRWFPIRYPGIRPSCQRDGWPSDLHDGLVPRYYRG